MGPPVAQTWKPVIRGYIGEDDEETVAVRSELALHLEQNLGELLVDDCEVGLALVDGERGEPFEDLRSGIRVSGDGAGGGGGVIERDMRSE